jgi:hypothetical protein
LAIERASTAHEFVEAWIMGRILTAPLGVATWIHLAGIAVRRHSSAARAGLPRIRSPEGVTKSEYVEPRNAQ